MTGVTIMSVCLQRSASANRSGGMIRQKLVQHVLQPSWGLGLTQQAAAAPGAPAPAPGRCCCCRQQLRGPRLLQLPLKRQAAQRTLPSRWLTG